MILSDDGGIQTDDVEESYGEETSATETDDDLNRRRDLFEGESADGAEDEPEAQESPPPPFRVNIAHG